MAVFPVSSTCLPTSFLLTIILSSIIKLSAESSPSSVNQSSLFEGIKQINSTDSPSPVSEEERQQYLDELQAATTRTMIPAMVFLLILTVTGLIGNSLVIFVYSLKFKPSATRIIIITIASIDLVANVLAIPGEIFNMFYFWTFTNTEWCRTEQFLKTFTTIGSVMVLLAVAVIRYRKICTPHGWQVTIMSAKIVSVVVVLLSILCAIPGTITTGRHTQKTPRVDILTQRCSTDDRYVRTIWPVLNYGLFLVLYVGCGIPLTVLYILIGIQAWKHTRRERSSVSVSTTHTNTGSNQASEASQSKPSQATSDASEISQNGNKLDSTDNLDINQPSNEHVENINFTELVAHLEQCTVRISADRLEIRTRLREIISNLHKTVSGLTDIPDNYVVQEEVVETNFEKASDSDPEMDCGLSSCLQAEGNPVHGTNTTAHRDVGCSDVCVDDSSLNSTKVVQQTDSSPVDSETGIVPTCAPTFDIEKNPEQSESILSCDIEQRTEQLTTVNSLLASENITNRDIDPTTSISCTTASGETASDKHSPHSLTSDISRTSSNPIAALNWLDIVYVPEGSHARSNSDTPKITNSVTFRISLSNKLLQKESWLKHLITETLDKSKSDLNSSREASDLRKDEHLKLENVIAINTDARCVHVDPSCAEKTKRNSSLTMKNRVKEWITRKRPSRQVNLKQVESNRQIVSRTNLMLVIISAVYILGFVPHFALVFYKFAAPKKVASMTSAEFTAYNLFIRTYFLNCAANPIIYSLCDRNFRRECIRLFSRLSRRRY